MGSSWPLYISAATPSCAGSLPHFLYSELLDRNEAFKWSTVAYRPHQTLPIRCTDLYCYVRRIRNYQFLITYHIRKEFFREILFNNIAIIAIQHSKIYFVDTFGDFSHTVE